MMKVITRADLLAHKPKLHQEPTPELGDGSCVYIREFSGRVREQFAKSIPEETTQAEIYRIACAFALCDADGNPLFSADDIDALADLDPALFDRLGKRCEEVNSTNKKAVESAKKP